MNKKELTLEALNINLKQFQETTDFAKQPLIRLASLYYYYEPGQLKEKAKSIFSESVSENDSIELFNMSRPYRDGTSELILEENERNQILKSFSSIEEIAQLYSKANIDLNEITQTFFGHYINRNAPSLEKQDMDQLVATYTITKWLKNTAIPMPEEREVLRYLKQRERLQPFIRLTRNFRGREDELRRLRDYVDFLPKKSFLEISESFIRSIIGWHEKPPLVIKGIGGSGKSTLIAKFILDHLDKGSIPFIYFDFDRPGLSLNNPISLLVEGLRQLALQFPNFENDFIEVANALKLLYSKNQNTSNITRSTDRQILYEYYFNEEKRIPDTPILIVFDSFEEIQYRASNTEISNLFTFLSELSDHIPRLRFVFAGRSDISYSTARFDSLPLGSFDSEAAKGYLQTLGIQNTEFQLLIYKKVGGHPLSLQVAADLILKEQKYRGHYLSYNEIEQLFSSINKRRKQEELIKRNLDHIHDDEVRAIAIPGILVRRIDPEVIQNILAVPCGFRDMSFEKATDIFIKLQKETFLLNKEGSEIYFSQELRCALHKLIIEDPDCKADQLHDAAIEYYSKRTDIPSKAEYLYHRLMRGDSPDVLEGIYEPSLRPYLENSLSELPDNAYVQLSRYMNAAVLESRRGNSDQKEWEDSVTNELINFFNSGDEYQINDILKLLQSRKKRSSKGLLNYYEAKFFTRLGNYNAAREILDKQIIRNTLNKSSSFIRPMLLYSKIHEYNQKYESANKYISEALEDFTVFFNKKKDSLELTEMIDLHLSSIRLLSRTGISYNKSTDSLLEILNNISFPINNAFPKPYNLYFKNCDSFEKISSSLSNLTTRFLSREDYDKVYKDYSRIYKDNFQLQKLLQDVGGGVFLKDITEPGVFKVILCEVIQYCETIGAIRGSNVFDRIRQTKPLTGELKNQLIDIISQTFDPKSFDFLLSIRLDKRLDRVGGLNDTFKYQIFRVVETAEREGRIVDLLNALVTELPNNAQLTSFVNNLKLSERE